MDRLPQRGDDHQPVQALQALTKRFNIKDGWRATNPNTLDFSFPALHKESRSRLDRIYTSKKITKLAEQWTIEASQINTDHKMVTAQITDLKAPFLGPGRWAMPLDIISDKEFMTKAIEKTTALKKAVRSSYAARTAIDNPQVHFGKYKEEILELARDRMKTKVPKVRRALEGLQADLEKMKENPDTNTTESLQTTMRLIEEKIAHLQRMSNQSRRLATTARYRLEGETVSRYWSAINLGRSPRDLIYSLSRPGVPPKTFERRSDRMANLARDYHEQLQEHSPPVSTQHRQETITKVCGAVEKTYEDCPENTLQNSTTEKDVLTALKASENGRASGINGIPYEYWKALSKVYEEKHKKDDPPQPAEFRTATDELDIVWILTKVYRDIDYFGIAPTTNFALGWMCPIYKNKGNRNEISSYRPITLLNSDYKILTKVLAMKLATVAPALIHEDQAGFVPKRQIFHQIRQAQLTISYAEAVEQDGVIIALDQEKAYDKIMHDYLWKVLDALHIPGTFTTTVKNLYAEAYTVVMVNGERSTPFKVTRGVRQGCPLSCLIFDLAIEPLACMLRQSTLIGITIPGLKERLIASLFADDTTTYLSSNDSLEDLEAILNEWTEASGGQFNDTKMEVIPIGHPDYREKVRAWRAPNATSKKFPPQVDVLQEGSTIRVLGAWIGNNPNPSISWSTKVKAIRSALNKWAMCHPSLNGKRLIVQMIVGGMTQYLTKAQGMPPDIEEEIVGIIRSFIWNDTKPMIDLESLFRSKPQGGLDLLDIHSRNQAIQLTWLRDYLDLTERRPNWCFIADALIGIAMKKRDGAADQSAKMNTFIQSWDPNLHSSKALPREIRQMLIVGKKFNVRMDTLKLPPALKRKLPIWYHIGAEQDLQTATMKPASQCLRKNHGVRTVEDVLAVTKRLVEVFPDGTGGLRRHLRRKNCACHPCKSDRSKGCSNPDKCCSTAKKLSRLLFPKYAPDMTPSGDGLSLTPRRMEANEEAMKDDGRIIFNPSVTDPEDISQTIRAFAGVRDDLSSRLPSMRPPRLRATFEELTVYTDGASMSNGDLDSRVGSGIWFGDGDCKNASLRIDRKGGTNQTGELMAALAATQRAPPSSTLHIRSDSKYLVDGLTKHLPRWEARGWIGVENADIFKALASTMRQRSAPTTLQWVKGHNGEYGNECADKHAGEGAMKDAPDHIPIQTHPSFSLTGAKLASLTQAIAYKGIRQAKPTKAREATSATIESARSEIKRNTNRLKSDKMIWKSIRSVDVSKPIQDFLWKCLHKAHKVGTFWSYIPDCEDRILCTHCEVEETMQHILCMCKAPGREVAWKLAECLWRRKHDKWIPITLGTILGASMIGFGDDTLPKKGGPDRLYRILISETAYLIWKLRCERVIQHGGDPDRYRSSIEIAHRWTAALNTRLTLDRQMTRFGLSKRALKKNIVKSTWCNVLENEEALAEDWLQATEVLVGSVDQEVLLNMDIDEPHTAG